ncbi:Acyl-CoA dehydrogenase family member 10 [Erysiphe neolycopersici]|uniref:Acyl-CoA dehydrogenase family member 10 n=1 Tax=Erysiphe neolycopersici TaxID=212602 RepID=A0A420I619_9PEZI|nr:Acyl-CoA dehydrogenase family member 10 [Erysiphe neolycopersici]
MVESIRQQIDIKSLEAYLSKNIVQLKPPTSLKQFEFGQSNPTYQITTSDLSKYVLRKKPPGALLSVTAHQIEREYRVLRALEKTDVPVPRVYCLCNDNSVIGTPFYIMEFLDGRIIEDPDMPGLPPKEKKEMWYDAVRTLAKLHSINPIDVDLQDFGKHSGFYDRQIKALNKVSQVQANVKDVETLELVGAIPHIGEMLCYFSNKKMQPQDRSSLTHGDYKIDNLVFHKTEPRVIVLICSSWEMATIGHPLSDLSNLTTPICIETQPQAKLIELFTMDTRRELTKFYAEIAGWDPSSDLSWGSAFGFFRLTVILQGIASRHALRQASSAKATDMAKCRHHAAQLAWEHVQMNIKNEKKRTRL